MDLKTFNFSLYTILKKDITKGVGNKKFGYGIRKKDKSGLQFTKEVKEKLEKEKEDFMKGNHKYLFSNKSNFLQNIIDKAESKVNDLNNKLAYKMDIERKNPILNREDVDYTEEDIFKGFKKFNNKYKVKKNNKFSYYIRTYNNEIKNEEVIKNYKKRDKFRKAAFSKNTDPSNILKFIVFDIKSVQCYFYNETTKKYINIQIDPENFETIRITKEDKPLFENETFFFSDILDKKMKSTINNLSSIYDDIKQQENPLKEDVLKLKIALDLFFKINTNVSYIKDIQNQYKDDYDSFIKQYFNEKKDNDIIFIYNYIKNIIEKILNKTKDKINFSYLMNNNFNKNKRVLTTMSKKTTIDYIQEMRRIRSSYNFSNDILKQQELFSLINDFITFSTGKINGTEYKIKQLVSKLPADKKAKGNEKLNKFVDSLKAKGLKESEILSRLSAKEDNIEKLVAFSKKNKVKKAATIAAALGTAGAGAAYALNDDVKYNVDNAVIKGLLKADDIAQKYDKNILDSTSREMAEIHQTADKFRSGINKFGNSADKFLDKAGEDVNGIASKLGLKNLGKHAENILDKGGDVIKKGTDLTDKQIKKAVNKQVDEIKKDAIEDVKDKASYLKDDLVDKMIDAKDATVDKLSDIKDGLMDKFGKQSEEESTKGGFNMPWAFNKADTLEYYYSNKWGQN